MHQVVIALIVLIVTHIIWGRHLYMTEQLKTPHGAMFFANVIAVVLLIHYTCMNMGGCSDSVMKITGLGLNW